MKIMGFTNKKSQQTSKLRVWLLVSLLCLTIKTMQGKEEIWKPIAGFEGIYSVSDQGNVKSHKYSKSRILKKGKDRSGYHFVILYDSENNKAHRNVHRIVMCTFNAQSNNELFVDHINGIKTDNRLENLRYCSRRDNLTFDNVKRKRKSKYAGVSYRNTGRKRWYAQIVINRKSKYLGAFNTEEEARDRYIQEVKQLA